MITFVAIEMEENIKKRISEYTRKMLRPCCKGGRWVHRDNYHITLKYLGDTREQDLGAVFDALSAATQNRKAFELHTAGPGIFGMQRDSKARVLWLGVSGELALMKEIKGEVEDRMAAIGYGMDRRFSPHITLARDVMVPDNIKAKRLLPSLTIPVNAISLMESRVEEGKRLYIPMSVHKLGVYR